MRYLNIASPVEDNELIQGCLRQDRKYQEAVFRRYAGKLLVVSLRYARHRMEAEDILQDAFIRIFDHIDQFQGKGSLEGWMRRIVVNTALKNIDKKNIYICLIFFSTFPIWHIFLSSVLFFYFWFLFRFPPLGGP